MESGRRIDHDYIERAADMADRRFKCANFSSVVSHTCADFLLDADFGCRRPSRDKAHRHR
jgi:hypothetical protein